MFCMVQEFLVLLVFHKKDVWPWLWGGRGRVVQNWSYSSFHDYVYQSPQSALTQFRLSYWLQVVWSLLWLVENSAAFTAHVCCMWSLQHLFFFQTQVSLIYLHTLCVITVAVYTLFSGLGTILMLWKCLWKGFMEMYLPQAQHIPSSKIISIPNGLINNI